MGPRCGCQSALKNRLLACRVAPAFQATPGFCSFAAIVLCFVHFSVFFVLFSFVFTETLGYKLSTFWILVCFSVSPSLSIFISASLCLYLCLSPDLSLYLSILSFLALSLSYLSVVVFLFLPPSFPLSLCLSHFSLSPSFSVSLSLCLFCLYFSSVSYSVSMCVSLFFLTLLSLFVSISISSCLCVRPAPLSLFISPLLPPMSVFLSQTSLLCHSVCLSVSLLYSISLCL